MHTNTEHKCAKCVCKNVHHIGTFGREPQMSTETMHSDTSRFALMFEMALTGHQETQQFLIQTLLHHFILIVVLYYVLYFLLALNL